MSRSFRYSPDERYANQNSGQNTVFDDSELSAEKGSNGESITANSKTAGDLQIIRQLSSKDKKRADKRFRKQRRHDDRQ